MANRYLFAPLLLVPLAAALPAAAQAIDGREEYRICLTLAKTAPEQGWEEALAWQSLGGGEAARHCAAVALIGLGKHEEAASRLETLANESKRAEPVRAEMLAQAGQAWLLAGNIQRADAAQRTALTLAPDTPDLLLDHAVTLAQAGRYDEASARLDRVLSLQPNRVEALVLRASASRYLDRLDEAERDVGRALELDPAYPDALLERGMVRRLKGDVAAARADWLAAINAMPDSPVAEVARRNLEILDVHPDKGS